MFYHNFIKKDNISDEQSLASYFDIICRFTKQNFKESLKTMTLNTVILFFYTHNSRYHLVLKCDNKKLDRKVLEPLSESIIDKFLINYNEVLDDFNGDISIFRSFSEELDDLLVSSGNYFKNLLIIDY